MQDNFQNKGRTMSTPTIYKQRSCNHLEKLRDILLQKSKRDTDLAPLSNDPRSWDISAYVFSEIAVAIQQVLNEDKQHELPTDKNLSRRPV
jgi:hypothetical protein